MNFSRIGEIVELRHHTSHSISAALIPVEEQEQEHDDDGYATAQEYLTSETDDCKGACEPQVRNSENPNSIFTNLSISSQVTQRRIPMITEPLRIDRFGSCSGQENKKSAKCSMEIISAALDLLKGFRLGSDISRLQLPPQFNLPKSQLQIFGEMVYCCAEDYLGMCADGATPVGRLLAVVRFHLSTTRPPPFLKAPFNPILGETHHVSVGKLNVLCEQVSHHPPISAMYATNEAKRLEMLWWHRALPRFYGGYVETAVLGERLLKLHEHRETYEFTSPNLQIRFFPNPGCTWVGATSVKCKETGLEAVVNFKSKAFFGMRGPSNKVLGKIFKVSSGEILYELNGLWDGVITLTDKATGATSTLYNAQSAIVDIQAPAVENLEELSSLESANVWSEVTAHMVQGDMKKAREAKRRVEDAQRVERGRVMSNDLWSPKHFIATQSSSWEWRHSGTPVPPAPLVVPTSHPSLVQTTVHLV